MAKRGKVRIGISGWRYALWRGDFYPEGVPQAQELAYAARCFDTIEINGTFYSLQRPEYFRRWAAETPDDFVFAVKGARFITHMRKLRDVETPPTSLHPACCALGASSGRSCGSSRRTSASMQSASRRS